MSNDGPIIDAQVHLWSQGLPSNPSHWQITSFLPAEAIAMMDEAGVDGAVIHPPGWDPDSTAIALKAVQDLATFPIVQIDTSLILLAIQRSRQATLSFWDSLILEAALASCQRIRIRNGPRSTTTGLAMEVMSR